MTIRINRNLALEKKTDFERWSNQDALEQAWDARAEQAAAFVPAGARVLDLGCGRMALRGFLPKSCIYQPCDLVSREPDTIVCDFNAGDFPQAAAADADVITMLGVLEYIVDADAFFAHLRRSACDIVLSYCASDFNAALDRASLGWISHFTLAELAALVDRHGFEVERTERIDELQILVKLRPADEAVPLAPCSVAVLSYYDVGNFGDRLGYHMINALLPPQADVHHLSFRALNQARESYDLVVLGIGNSVFHRMLNEETLDIVKRGKAAIGIFGTQYHELIQRPLLDRLIDGLDTWFARYEEDVLTFGRGRRNVVHLGDWLIDQFPMAQPSEDKLLEVGEDIWSELPLDRIIQQIQRHKNVFSTRMHPLLCALTSAELVAYTEQREAGSAIIVTGKFRSMLIDIFGRTFPERKFFEVDRAAVTRYKARVHANVALVGERIEAVLRNVAATA
jgi:methyltransferase family protein